MGGGTNPDFPVFGVTPGYIFRRRVPQTSDRIWFCCWWARIFYAEACIVGNFWNRNKEYLRFKLKLATVQRTVCFLNSSLSWKYLYFDIIIQSWFCRSCFRRDLPKLPKLKYQELGKIESWFFCCFQQWILNNKYNLIHGQLCLLKMCNNALNKAKSIESLMNLENFLIFCPKKPFFKIFFSKTFTTIYIDLSIFSNISTHLKNFMHCVEISGVI